MSKTLKFENGIGPNWMTRYRDPRTGKKHRWNYVVPTTCRASGGRSGVSPTSYTQAMIERHGSEEAWQAARERELSGVTYVPTPEELITFYEALGSARDLVAEKTIDLAALEAATIGKPKKVRAPKKLKKIARLETDDGRHVTVFPHIDGTLVARFAVSL